MPRTHPPPLPKPRPPKSDGFRLTITSLEQFAAFIAIIRNDDLEKLPEMTARLRASTTALADAEQANPAPTK